MRKENVEILGIVIIWVGVIFASAIVLAGTEYLGMMIPILGGGAAGSLIILGGARAMER